MNAKSVYKGKGSGVGKGKGKAVSKGQNCAVSTCTQANAQNKCTACKRVWYCSRSCQVVDWKAGHKQQCKIWTAELRSSLTIDEKCTSEDLQRPLTSTCVDVITGQEYKQVIQQPDHQEKDRKDVGENEEECVICLEALFDPVSRCKISQHKLCRKCADTLKEKGVTNVCPQCRGKMDDSELLFREANLLIIRAGTAHTRAELGRDRSKTETRPALCRLGFKKLEIHSIPARNIALGRRIMTGAGSCRMRYRAWHGS
jgi:hypothetical protein